MQASGWLQLAFYVVVLALITKPMGLYLLRVLDTNGKTWLDPVLRPLERGTYRVMGVDPNKEHDWKQYTLAMLLFSLVGCLFTYAILRLQYFLPLNPEKFAGLSSDLSFNTSVSFTTNTNWQNYVGESTMSYLSQMVGLTFHNFVSAATGIAIAAALVRGIARHSAQTLGNFWVDLVRVTYYLLIPICLVFAVFLVSQGMIDNFKPYTKATLVEPMKVSVAKVDKDGKPVVDAQGKPAMEEQTVTEQNIVQGPMASQVAIKMLGTNGGGYTNANAAEPFENPTPFSNFVQMLSIFSIGSGLTYYLGRMVKNQKHGWTVWAVMLALFIGGVMLCWWAEANGNPIHHQLGVAAADGNMEGKEVRFGIFNSALFATVTTDASCGAVNSMHDSFTPLGGFVPLFNIQLGEIIYWRRRRRPVRNARLRCARCVHRRTDGWPHAGISREENRGLRRQDGNVVVVNSRDFHSGIRGVGDRQQVGPGWSEQQRAARAQRNSLRVQLGRRKQWQRLRWIVGQHTLVQHHPRPGHVVRPFLNDRTDHGPGGFAGPKESCAR